MTQRQQHVVVPHAVMDKLNAVKGRTLKVRISTALVAAVVVLMAAMALAMLVDWLATLYDSQWRIALTYSALTAAGVTFCIWGMTAWRQSRQIRRAASDVDRGIPQLEQRWSTIAQLSTSPHAKNVHPAMYRKVAQEASSWSPRVDPEKVVSLEGLIHVLWGLTAITAVLGVAAVLDAHRTSVLLRRFWAPTSSISATEFVEVPGNVVVARGEPLKITAQMEGTLVRHATLTLEPDGSDSQLVTLLPKGDEAKHLSHRIRSINVPLRYRLQAGDGQTPWYSVEVADRPQLGEVQLTVVPPAYTRQESNQLHKFPRKISTLKGSLLQLAIHPKDSVENVELQFGGDRSELLTVDEQGWYRWETTLEESFAMSPVLTESHGLTNSRPPTCKVVCREDAPPVVKILKPNDQLAVLPDDTIPITFSAKDDIGLGSAELLVFDERLAMDGDPLPLATLPIPLGEQQGKTEIRGTVDLDLSQFDLDDGSQLSFAIRVSEDRGAAKNVEAASQTENMPDGSSTENKASATENLESVTEAQTPSAPRNAANSSARDAQETKLAQSDRPSADPSASTEKLAQESVPNSSEVASTMPRSSRSGENEINTSADPGSNSSSQIKTGYLEFPQAQSTTSQRMRLTVDESVLNFIGQQRLQLEIEIAPDLERIDIALGKAQQLSRSVLDEIEKNPKWLDKYYRDMNNAEAQVASALNVVDKLHYRTRDTLYSFIGLQLLDISQAHIYPARKDFWKALQTEDESRIEAIRTGWQQTVRARELLERLTGQFERARRDYALAETIDAIKKMYQIYVENSLALMREEGDSSPYSRKMVEFDLDEEYLARLKEVLEMRNKMRAELARLLADDPRLLRRFLDAERNRTRVLRFELADLAEQHRIVNRKSKSWDVVEEAHRTELAAILLQRHVNGIESIAIEAADLHDRFEIWLPLNRNTQDAELLTTDKLLQQIAVATQEVSASAGKFAGQQTGTPPPTAQDAASSDEETPEPSETDTTQGMEALDVIVADAERLYDQFNRLEVVLNQIGARDEQIEIAGFATNRLLETRRLVEKTSAWIRQLKYHQSGEYHRAAEIEQHQLVLATDRLAGKFADLEQQLSVTLRIQDGTLPLPIAEKARSLLATLDEQAVPNQLAAVYGLRRNKLPSAISRQEAALEALQLAEKEYDAMIELVIIELDKFPVQDPIASLLDDPTLDELLAALEQELSISDILGIPNRPSNLQIVDDWMRDGMGSGSIGNYQNQVLMNKFREQQLRRQRAIEKAFRKALARAMKESETQLVVKPSTPARAIVDWNRLVSRLGDDLQQGRNTAPPERYRRAIEQYFRQISGASDEKANSK